MKSVKRYDGKIEHCDNGGYVTFADYKKLEARLENAEGRERKHCKRAETAEAELERLKAQEPVAYTDAEELETLNKGTFADMFTPCDQYKNDPQWIPLYAEPRPAVLPPEKSLGEEFKAYDWAKRALAQAKVEGYNECRADALELGYQPQKFVVVLPAEEEKGHGHYWLDYVDTVEAIEAAGGEIAE